MTQFHRKNQRISCICRTKSIEIGIEREREKMVQGINGIIWSASTKRNIGSYNRPIKLNTCSTKLSISDADNDCSHRSSITIKRTKGLREWRKTKRTKSKRVQWQPKKGNDNEHTHTQKPTKKERRNRRRMLCIEHRNIRRQTRQSVIRYFYWLTLINIITNNNNMYQL